MTENKKCKPKVAVCNHPGGYCSECIKEWSNDNELNSKVYRFNNKYDLVIKNNHDDSVTFYFWADIDEGINSRHFDWCEPVYEVRFG